MAKSYCINSSTCAATTAIVAPVTYVCAKNNATDQYVSVLDMFKNSKLYKQSTEADRQKMLKAYEGIYVIEGSKL